MKKTLFNEKWQFRKASSESWATVNLPHDAMIMEERRPDAPGGDAVAFFNVGEYVYEKKSGINARKAVLSFDGVYRDAKVYLNGVLKEECHYGYSPFTAELGEIKEDDVIKVECGIDAAPDSRWYPGAGIYRDVYLYTTDVDEYVRVNGIKVSTIDYSKGLIHVKVDAETSLIEILDKGNVIASIKGNDEDITIENARLWSEHDPYLYVVRVTVGNDTVEETFGIRQVEKGTDGLYINGHKTLLRGGCLHHDNGLLGSATYYKSEYRRVKILKEAGFNAIRSAHNPTSEALLKACDELGMYVMDETWDMWYNHKNKYDYATYWEENHMKDIERLVERDFNHPSVIMYSLGNEVSEPATQRGIEDTREMAEYVRSLDKNRLVTGGFNLMIITNASKGKGIYKEEGGMNNNTNALNGMNSTMFNLITSFIGSGMNKAANSKKSDEVCSPSLDILDIAGYNYASGRYALDQKLHPDRLIFGSETMPYDIGKNWKMVEEMDNVTGDFMWTAWDYIGENGIGAWGYTDDAKGFAKPYPWWLADTGAFDIIGTPNGEAFWATATWGFTDKPLITVRPVNHENKVIKASWRGTNGIPSYSWRNCDGKKGIAEVFFKADRIDLYQNGKKIGSRNVKENRAVFNFSYVPGILEAVAFDTDKKEIGRNTLVSAADDTAVVIRAEDETVKAGDIVYVNITVEDSQGIVESNSDRKVTMEVENGEILAMGSANPRLLEDIHDNECSTYYGRALAIIRAEEAGVLRIKTENQVLEINVEE